MPLFSPAPCPVVDFSPVFGEPWLFALSSSFWELFAFSSSFSDEPWPVVERSGFAWPLIRSLRSLPGCAPWVWPRLCSAAPAPFSALPLLWTSSPPFAPDEPDDIPCSGARPAAPGPSRIPCADARLTPANSATVPSKNFFLIMLRCIVSFLSGCPRENRRPHRYSGGNRCIGHYVPGYMIGHETLMEQNLGGQGVRCQISSMQTSVTGPEVPQERKRRFLCWLYEHDQEINRAKQRGS